MEISSLEKGLFSNLQSEFYKFIHILENHTNQHNKCSDSYLKKVIILNEQMRLLENMIHELKIDIYTNNVKNTSNINKKIEDYDKDQKVLDYFKPFMLYYRFMLN
jgi:hypothetical protein|tara:strand:- start:26 stop:340 length:315 start_codon:yes stop_codon:yes gene_type:complete